MWALAGINYCVAKVSIWISRRRSSAPIWKHVGFLVAWPGMDVDAFLFGRVEKPPRVREWLFAIAKCVMAAVLLLVAYSWPKPFGVVAAWIGMIAIVMAIHFGLFHVLSCIWRANGVKAMPVMNLPIASKSISDFWSHRWNLAFRDLTKRLCFLPLSRRMHASSALLTSFIASGAVHDLVISLPAGGGYGLPTLYFTFQGIAVLADRKRNLFSAQPRSTICGWMIAFLVIVLPLPLLFHSSFIHKVIIPFFISLRG